MRLSLRSVLLLSAFLAGGVARADTVVSANDAHSILKDGKQVLPSPLEPDTLSVLAAGKDGVWRVTGSGNVPASVVGPPTGLLVLPGGKTAFVASATTADVAEGKIVPDDRLSVVDLSGPVPHVVQTVHAAKGVTTMRLTPDGKHVLTANGVSSTLCWFRWDGHHLSDRQVITLPTPGGFTAGVAILPDGRHALVSLWKGDKVFGLSLDGDRVSVDPDPLLLAPGAWTIRLTPDAHYAAINVLGHGEGKPGEIAMVDASSWPLKIVQRVPVPNAPEGMDISPDGRFLAVVSQNGSAMPPTSPLYHPRGIVTVFGLSDGRLTQLAQAPGTLWPQGLIFSPDGRSVLVQGVMDRTLRTLSWDGTHLKVVGDAPLPGGGANIERQR